MLKKRHILLAKRSMTVAIAFCLCGMAGSGLTGDLSALQVTEHQPAKLAAMEAEFETQEPPASWNIVALPSQDNMENLISIRVPALLGLIATHSLDTPVPGLRDIVAQNEVRVANGAQALSALNKMRAGTATEDDKAIFNAHQDDLGYGLLLSTYAQDVSAPTEAEIKMAAHNSVPPVFISFVSFRAMMTMVGLIGLLTLGAAFFLWYKRDLVEREKFLKILIGIIPLPFIACEFGWILAEVGRQPWAIQDILPTVLATSSLSAVDVGLSLLCFIGIYTLFLLIELTLMYKTVQKGPESSEVTAHGGAYA